MVHVEGGTRDFSPFVRLTMLSHVSVIYPDERDTCCSRAASTRAGGVIFTFVLVMLAAGKPLVPHNCPDFAQGAMLKICFDMRRYVQNNVARCEDEAMPRCTTTPCRTPSRNALCLLRLVVPYVAQIVSGVGYAHNQHICHRDMKLDNVLLSRRGCLREIKLADFGLSDFYRPGATMRTNCGSISYLAPEVRHAVHSLSYFFFVASSRCL